MSKLFVFDMDGTLLPGSTASLEIAKVTETNDELHDLERRFFNRELDTRMFAREIHRIWGVLDRSIIRQAFDNAPKLAHIDTVISVLSNRGDFSCLITMSPDFFAELFYEYGFDKVFASGFPREADDAFDASKILTPHDKLNITKRLCEELGVDIVDVVAFGDSMSDEHFFENLIHTVAVNGNPELQKLAKYRYEGSDLAELFHILQL